MKKTLKIIRLVLIAAFLTVGIMLAVNAVQIAEHRAKIEQVIEDDVAYFSDKFSFTYDYYKYKDENSIEYWVDRHTGEFDYMINTNLSVPKTLNEEDAKKLALLEAKKWDEEFFKSTIMIDTIAESKYEFYIHQLNDSGLKSGKFIIVKVTGSSVEYLSMHTVKNNHNEFSGSCIGEKEAIDTAYSQIAITDTPLLQEDNHLVKTHLYKDNSQWIWEIKVWEITNDKVQSKAEAIDMNRVFVCIIHGNSGDILSAEWLSEDK